MWAGILADSADRPDFDWILELTVDYVHCVPLAMNLTFFRDWQASDPRDEMYGIYGIAQLGNEKTKKLRSDFEFMDVEPNYQVATLDLYQDIAYNIIYLDGTLDILSVPRLNHLDCKLLPFVGS